MNYGSRSIRRVQSIDRTLLPETKCRPRAPVILPRKFRNAYFPYKRGNIFRLIYCSLHSETIVVTRRHRVFPNNSRVIYTKVRNIIIIKLSGTAYAYCIDDDDENDDDELDIHMSFTNSNKYALYITVRPRECNVKLMNRMHTPSRIII